MARPDGDDEDDFVVEDHEEFGNPVGLIDEDEDDDEDFDNLDPNFEDDDDDDEDY